MVPVGYYIPKARSLVFWSSLFSKDQTSRLLAISLGPPKQPARPPKGPVDRKCTVSLDQNTAEHPPRTNRLGAEARGTKIPPQRVHGLGARPFSSRRNDVGGGGSDRRSAFTCARRGRSETRRGLPTHMARRVKQGMRRAHGRASIPWRDVEVGPSTVNSLFVRSRK